MKARLTKLFTLLTILTLGITNVWGADPTYEAPATKTYGAITFLDVAGTAKNATDALGNDYLTYGVYYVAKTKGITTWFNSSDGSPASNHESTGYSIPDAADYGFFPVSTTSSDINYGGTKCHSTRQRYFYVTGATSVAAIVRDGDTKSNKYAQISIQTVAIDGTLGTATIYGDYGSKTSGYLLDGGALDPDKYYKISFTSQTTTNCFMYQIRLGKASVPSCDATVPGNISKGALSAGVLTLNAAEYGSKPATDEWYWQTAADGVDKSNSGASFNVTAAGTYYVRSLYNNDCWSDAKSFEVKATDLVANYTVIYKDGTTELGSETVEVGHHPTGSEIAAPTKDCYTYAGWDPALNTVSGSDGDEVVVNATWTPLYASSFNFGTTTDLTKDNIATKLATSNIFCSVGTGGSYDDGGTTGYLGYKFKNNGDYVTFIVQNGYEAIVTYGYTESGWQVNGADAGVTVKTKAYVDKKYQAEGSDLLLKLVNQSANSKTSVLTNIVIKATATGEDDATLSDLSVSGYTLNPSFDSATEDYTITKEYGAADPVVGDVTATPSVTDADADIAWDGTNHKFVITVTAKDGVTKKTYNITINEAEARKSLSRVLFNNGFDAFIDNTNHTVKAFYLAGTTAPTATTITAGAGTAGTLSEGKIRVTGADDSYVDYIVTLAEVTPNTTTVAEDAAAGEFAGDEAWVKNGLLIYGNAAGYSAGDKWYVNRRLTKSGDAADDQRVIAGWVRSYFFVGNAKKFIMTVGGNNAVKYAIDGGDQVANASGTLEIALTKGNHMIEVVSNQSSGDCRLSAPKLVELPASHTVTYMPGDGTGTWVVDDDATEVADCPSTFTAPEGKIFNGWKDGDNNDVEVGAAVTTDMALTAQWINHYAVTFNMNGHGDAPAAQDIKHGEKATKPADPIAVGFDFGGWFTDAACTAGNEFDFNTPITAATPLYAKWTADPCPDKKSIVKAVMATNTTATVTGYNSNEYAGGYIVNNLADDASNTNMYDFGEGEVKGFKLKGSNSAIFATLSKGGFEVGDQVVFAVTKNAGDNKLAIYAAKDKDHVLKLVELDVDAAGIYTYRLTQDNIDAIEAAGSDYLSIGTFRGDYNPYIYSVELKGCRSWAIFHTLTFKNFDGTATIAAEPLEEGAYASTVAPTAPKITLKRFLGWAEAVDGTPVDLTSYTITEDKTLYAVYEDIVCPTTGTVYKFQLKTDLASETLPSVTNKDMSSYITASGDGYLTYTATANNKATINSDGTIQMKDASAAYLKVELECALAAGDQIRAHVTNNPMRVQVGTNYDSNKDLILAKNAYEFVAITSAMEGKQVLYITRSSNGNANLADFEIYRPAKYDVSFNMMGHGSAIADLEDVVEGSKIAAPSPAPTDADYSFAGWYKENTLENEWNFDVDVVNDNITLYAKWLDKSDATLKSLKYGETDIVLVVDQYTYDITLPSLTSSVPALTAETNNPNASKVIVDGTFDGEGNAISTVTVTPEAGADKVYTVNFARGMALEQVMVTTSMEWDWSAAGVTAEINNTNTPGLSGNDVVIANVPGVNNDADFNSQALKASGTNAIRTTYFQGKELNIKTDKEGMLIVDFSGTNTKARVLKVYDNADTEIAAWNYNSDARQVQQVVVPAGNVTLKAFEGTDAQNARIYNLKFFALGYTRSVTEGNLATVCLPNACIARGVEVYELQGKEATYGKIVFDQLGADEVLGAGNAYLLSAKSSEAKFYFTTTPAVSTPDESNAMRGTFKAEGETFQPGSAKAENVYFVKDHALWSAKETGVKIGQYRAYLQMNEVTAVTSSSPAPGRRYIMLGTNGTNVATGIDDVQDDVRSTKMLIDGRLFILRGEKIYDATGRLVK